ncbi:MAG: hypothetical protein KA713_10125 [Chryseotalea sp. WA131a]|nr:MAG: hypothetical protein KA713_10125 [Chryseotalea sp. WA131a]
MKNKTMITDSPSHCANMVLWVSAALHKIKHGWLGFGQRGGKRGHAIGADSKPEKQWTKVYEFVSKDKYDKEFGWVVEYGIETVDNYFYLKGRIIQMEIQDYLISGKKLVYYEIQESTPL